MASSRAWKIKGALMKRRDLIANGLSLGMVWLWLSLNSRSTTEPARYS